MLLDSNNTPMTYDQVQKLVKKIVGHMIGTRATGDTPLDAKQLVNKEYCDANSGSPGGSDTQVQFNDANSFNGDPTFTFNKTSNVLKVETISGNTNSELLITTPVGNGVEKINITSGNGSIVSSNGVDVFITTGNGGASAVGGKLRLAMGSGINYDASGVITFFPTTGELRVATPNAIDGNNHGGKVAFNLGAGFGTGSYGDVIVAPGSNSTSRNGGFLVVPASGGTPTGTPTNYVAALQIPIVYDTSANKLWAYNGSWKSVTLA